MPTSNTVAEVTTWFNDRGLCYARARNGRLSCYQQQYRHSSWTPAPLSSSTLQHHGCGDDGEGGKDMVLAMVLIAEMVLAMVLIEDKLTFLLTMIDEYCCRSPSNQDTIAIATETQNLSSTRNTGTFRIEYLLSNWVN